jgi:lipoprotein-anchoring transpeptidase ErfK/SrfK
MSFRGPARRLIVTLAAAGLFGLAAGTAADASPAAPAARASAAPRAQATQELVVLLSQHAAHQAPDAGSPLRATVSPIRPITGEPTTLPVLARSIGAGGVVWLQVMLPGRPDGLTGWIAQPGTRAAVTPWRITLNLHTRRVTVYNDGTRVRVFRAVVGKPSTPTPTGQFFVEEVVQMQPGEPGGPFALALSARSNALQEFEGGPGQIAMHGRDNLGGTLGAAESHGCVRLGTAAIDWLAARVGGGTPVTITAG